jgi:hypothetical protein
MKPHPISIQTSHSLDTIHFWLDESDYSPKEVAELNTVDCLKALILDYLFDDDPTQLEFIPTVFNRTGRYRNRHTKQHWEECHFNGVTVAWTTPLMGQTFDHDLCSLNAQENELSPTQIAAFELLLAQGLLPRKPYIELLSMDAHIKEIRRASYESAKWRLHCDKEKS